MRRDSWAPFLILALLVGLAAGGAALGLSQAPPGADLAVHNGAGETVAASRITAYYTPRTAPELIRIDYSSTGQSTETLVRGGPPGRPPEVRHVPAAQAKQLLTPVSQLLDVKGFTRVGSAYHGSQPVATLLHTAREAAVISGTVRYKATVINGYVVDVTQSASLRTPRGTATEGGHYHITEISGWKVPAA